MSMEERDQNIQPPANYSASATNTGTASRMAALPQAAQSHGASPAQAQQQQQQQQQQQHHQQPQHHYTQTNGGHHQAHPQQTSNTQQHDYRIASNGTPSVSLPPIQHFEPLQNTMPQAPPSYAHMNGDGHQMNQHAPAPVAYQYQGNTMPAMVPPNSQVMYATRDGYTDRRYTPPPPMHAFQQHLLPHNPMDPRQMSGGRHKKEIKRRTKTGCLTCRKRRIKCDERQPGCRNCEKSKRECLGYDPIFKPSSGPAPIQPAPANTSMKPDDGMQHGYPQPQFQRNDDLYSGARPSHASSNMGYAGHTYSQPSLDNQPSNPSGTPHQFHPPFDPSHKNEASLSKV